jgi:hypothetical protein
MRRFLLPVLTVLGLTLSVASHAQSLPVTATCKDGSPFWGTTRSGACRGHGGVQTWNTTASSPAPSTTSPASAPAPTTTKAAPVQGSRGTPGAGQVWVNTTSKIYHCPGDRWYGKTKAGEYMPESQAKSSGYRADHNKTCTS